MLVFTYDFQKTCEYKMTTNWKVLSFRTKSKSRVATNAIESGADHKMLFITDLSKLIVLCMLDVDSSCNYQEQ